MKDVLKLMDHDHQELENLFEQFLSDLKSNIAQAIDVFSQFRKKLKKHFSWEEKILFPLFEERTGPPGKDIIFVLINEHDQINKMFINKIDTMLSENEKSAIADLAVGLNEMLTMHRKMEDEIFYPWFDQSLDTAERMRVLKKLKSNGDPPN